MLQSAGIELDAGQLHGAAGQNHEHHTAHEHRPDMLAPKASTPLAEKADPEKADTASLASSTSQSAALAQLLGVAILEFGVRPSRVLRADSPRSSSTRSSSASPSPSPATSSPSSCVDDCAARPDALRLSSSSIRCSRASVSARGSPSCRCRRVSTGSRSLARSPVRHLSQPHR